MGPSIKKPIAELPDFKGRLLQNIDFLDGALGVMQNLAGISEPPSLDIGAPDSTVQIEVIDAHHARVKLTYRIDNDSEAENGRAYLIDRFDFDPRDKKWENVSYSRDAEKFSGSIFWEGLASKLRESTKPPPESAQAFFERVIVPFELPEPEEKKAPPSPYEILKPALPPPVPFGGRSLPPPVPPGPPRAAGNLLTRQERWAPHLALGQAEDVWLQSAGDAGAFLPFLAGSACFRMGRTLSFGLFSELGLGNYALSGALSAGVGVAMEASAFEAAERLRRGASWENFHKGAWESFKNFGIFHASGHLLQKIQASPAFVHLGSWGVMHGMNEWQRAAGLRPYEGDYPLRLLLDGAFYAHAAASGNLVGAALGVEHPFFFEEGKAAKRRVPKTLIDEPGDEILADSRERTVVFEMSPVPPPETRLLLRSTDGTKELRASAVDGGKWSLAPAVELEADSTHPGRYIIRVKGLFSKPLRVNATAVKAGEAIYIDPGALVHYEGSLYYFFAREPGAFEREFHAQELPFQNEWWSKLQDAKGFDQVRQVLGQIQLASAALEAKIFEDCLLGKASVDGLSPLIQSKALEIMEAENALRAPHLPQAFDSMLEDTHAAFGGNHIEQNYHLFGMALRLRAHIEAATSVEEVLEALRVATFRNLEGSLRVEAFDKIDKYRQGKLKLQEVPLDFGLRQRLADLAEFQFYRQHQEGGLRPYHGMDASFDRNWRDLEAEKTALLAGLGSLGRLRGSAKTYVGGEMQELAYEALERGKPLETIPTEGGTRRRVMDYMDKVVSAAQRLFGPEWSRAGNRNLFSGEHFGDPAEPERHLQARYRFARMLLNEKAGLPIFGEPTEKEKGTLVWFAKEKLKVRGDLHYADAQAAIRKHLEAFSVPIREGLRAANQEERALVMEAYFGSQQHRVMSDPYKAFEVARFLGEVGFYREVGVTVELSGKRMHTYLSLGDLNSVHPEKSRQYFVLHTHPEEYLNRQGDVMGSAKYQGRTIVLGQAEVSRDTRNVLFSHQDVRLFVSHARSLFAEAAREPALDLSIFYDRQARVFRNWVQHPFGLAEMRVYLSPAGLPLKVEIDYGVMPEAKGDSRHLAQAAALRRDMAAELKIPVTVTEGNAFLIASRMPFARR